MAGLERLVLDTNVVLSGLLFPVSVPSRALLKAQQSVVLASNVTRQEAYNRQQFPFRMETPV